MSYRKQNFTKSGDAIAEACISVLTGVMETM